MEKYEGLHAKNPMITAVSVLLKLNDAELAHQVKQLKADAPPNQSVGRIDADYTRATVIQVHDFEPDYAVRVLDILTHLRFFNDARDNAIFYERLTFTPNLSKESYDNAIQNVGFSRTNMVAQSRGIVGMITRLEENYPPPKI